MIRALICKLFGHKWRRLTKGEHTLHGAFKDTHAMRICRRCGAERIAKTRTTRAKQS